MPNFRKIAMLTLGILAGNWVVDQWVIRSEANPNGFVSGLSVAKRIQMASCISPLASVPMIS